jgi:nitrate/nitrite transport system ATP-binding protein
MLELSNLTKIYPTPNGDFCRLENLNLKCGFVSILDTLVAEKNDIIIYDCRSKSISVRWLWMARLFLVLDLIEVLSFNPKFTAMDECFRNVLLESIRCFMQAKKQRLDICKYYLKQSGSRWRFDKKQKNFHKE